jgi:hypothetical protein
MVFKATFNNSLAISRWSGLCVNIQTIFIYKPLVIFIHTLHFSGGRRGRYRSVVGFTSTYSISDKLLTVTTEAEIYSCS